jgi:hypothetical protein
LGVKSQTTTWNGAAGDGDFSNGANWDTGAAPTATSDASISLSVAETITAKDAEVQSLILSGETDGVFTISGTFTVWDLTVNSGTFEVPADATVTPTNDTATATIYYATIDNSGTVDIPVELTTYGIAHIREGASVSHIQLTGSYSELYIYPGATVGILELSYGDVFIETLKDGVDDATIDSIWANGGNLNLVDGSVHITKEYNSTSSHYIKGTGVVALEEGSISSWDSIYIQDNAEVDNHGWLEAAGTSSSAVALSINATIENEGTYVANAGTYFYGDSGFVNLGKIVSDAGNTYSCYFSGVSDVTTIQTAGAGSVECRLYLSSVIFGFDGSEFGDLYLGGGTGEIAFIGANISKIEVANSGSYTFSCSGTCSIGVFNATSGSTNTWTSPDEGEWYITEEFYSTYYDTVNSVT